LIVFVSLPIFRDSSAKSVCFPLRRVQILDCTVDGTVVSVIFKVGDYVDRFAWSNATADFNQLSATSVNAPQTRSSARCQKIGLKW
jgi:hypothetical protein